MRITKQTLARLTNVSLWRIPISLACAILAVICVASAQRPFREYPGFEYEDYPKPGDWMVPGEWTFARLMYPSAHRYYAGEYPRPYFPNWWDGRTDWTIDYPRSDRHLSEAVRRLTRIQTRSVEEPVNLDDGDEVYHWPWLYGVEVGHWNLTDAQAAKLRDFLLRGGFFMCDDFHGTDEWAIFLASMDRVFPDRPIVDIDNKDPIFHTIFDLEDRYQVPGEQFVYSHRRYEKDGFEAHWRGIYDDKGRLMVAICHDMDLGDSWEHADNPRYPEQFSALGLRIGINYITYAMTH